jgi:hypothetical protein
MGGITLQFTPNGAAHPTARTITSNNVFCAQNLVLAAAIVVCAFKVDSDRILCSIGVNFQIDNF